jgi:hypothetical protein
MFEAGDEAPKPLPITSPPIIECELRVIVFKARNVVNKDMGGQNDLFFKVGLVGVDHKQTRFGSTQTTDTHYFATDGKGSFNYRLLYRFTIPVTKAKLRLAAYDRDVIGANDNIGEAVVPLTGLCRDLMRAIDLSPGGRARRKRVRRNLQKRSAGNGEGVREQVRIVHGRRDGRAVGSFVPPEQERADAGRGGDHGAAHALTKGGAETRGERPGTAQPRSRSGSARARALEPVRPHRVFGHHHGAGHAAQRC